MESSLPMKKRFIESSSFFKNCDDEDPFSEMKIDDFSFLDEVPKRSNCPKCNKSRKYYCYTCYVAVEEVRKKLPFVSLPVKIDIIKHPKEVDGKSTSAHAAVLAPEDVVIYNYPDFPSYKDEKVLLIFPGPSAISFEEWWHSKVDFSTKCINETALSSSKDINTENEASSLVINSNVHFEKQQGRNDFPFSKIVFIDSTWRQTKALYSDPRLKKLPCVVLSSYKSLFWRYYREKLDTHLSTIEAIYYFLVELHALSNPDLPYEGQYDNMLFFFRFMYHKIRTLYDPLKIKAYRNHNDDS